MTAADPGITEPAVSRGVGKRGLRLGGFAWRDGRIEVVKTGARLRLDGHLIFEVANWAVYLVVLAVAVVTARVGKRRPVRVWYAPDRPGPWYLLRGVGLWAGFRAASSPSRADIACYFDDCTVGSAPRPPGLAVLNGGCTDISKTRVAEVFADVFGYALAIDPQRAAGPIVEKSEGNGLHDGRVVTAPLRPRPGRVYERLVDTVGPDGKARDLRTPCIGGRPVVVWEKTKTPHGRFALRNERAVLRDPDTVFSPREIDLITRFNGRMGLDCGGLDILRDRGDGRIYIVDVNKTDLGPVIALSWPDKIRSMNRLSRAISHAVEPVMPEQPEPAPRAKAWAPLLPIAAAAALMLVWAWLRPQNGALAAIDSHAALLRAWVGLHPRAAAVLFAMAYATAVTVMLPVALIMTFAGGYLLGPATGGLGSITGATLGAVVAYGLARLTPAGTPHRLEARFPRLRRLREDFVSRPFRYILSMRLMPLTPFTLVSLAAGLNRIGLRPLVLGTALGVAPECLVYATVGAGFARGTPGAGMANLAQPVVWGGLALLALLAWLTMSIGRGKVRVARSRFGQQ